MIFPLPRINNGRSLKSGTPAVQSKQTEILVPISGLVCAQVSKVRCLADLTTGGLIAQQRLTSSRALLVWAIIENTPPPPPPGLCHKDSASLRNKHGPRPFARL